VATSRSIAATASSSAVRRGATKGAEAEGTQAR